MRDSQNRARAPRRMVTALSSGSEFDQFLYAPIGDSSDDLPLSVLSALARQDLDPWGEAATLARLSRDSAIARFTPVIFAVTSRNPGPADPAANAARLIALLPRSPNFIPGHDPASTDEPDHSRLLVIYVLFGLMMIVCAALGHWLRSFN
jgi:hypothetical protein